MSDKNNINTKKETDSINLRSPEVHEILTRPPHWLVRAGISVMTVFLLILIVGSYFFKSPYILEAKVTITTSNPPVPLVAKSSGKIAQLFVKEKDFVGEQAILAVLENTAEYTDVLYLKRALQDFDFTNIDTLLLQDLIINKGLSLGDIQSYYSGMQSQLADYLNFFKLDYHRNKIASIEKQISAYRKYHKNLKRQKALLSKELSIVKKQYLKDSSLYKKDVISEVEWEQSKMAYIQKRVSFQSTANSLVNNEIQINQAEQQILDLQLQKQEQVEQKRTRIKESLFNLKAQLRHWEKLYLFESPVKGEVSFTKVWAQNQQVNAGEKLLTIVPVDSSQIIGRMQLQAIGAGKVKPGQNVNIKLDNYPYMEYGMIRTTVKSVSLIPDENVYYLEVDLPQNLITNYGKKLSLQQEMSGVAEIIAEDMRLIERLINPVRALIKNKVVSGEL